MKLYSAKGKRSRSGHGVWVYADEMLVGEITYDSYHVNWNTFDSGIAKALADYLSEQSIKDNTTVAMRVASFIILYRVFGKGGAVVAAERFAPRLRPVIDGGRRRWTMEELLAEVIEANAKPSPIQ